MDSLKLKKEQLFSVLERLQEAIEDLGRIENSEKSDERKYRSYRDSLIQRFELAVDLFWKYVKKYLEIETKRVVAVNAPKPVIREACNAKLISEHDAQTILEMIDDRNMSSHIYKEEIADQISARASKYYVIMKKYSEKLS